MMVLFTMVIIITVNNMPIADDVNFLLWAHPIRPEIERGKTDFDFEDVSEIRLVFRSLIRLYQMTISAHDLPACNFTQTCSQFMSQAIRDYGPIHGLLMTSDRLQRCNHSARGYYRIDPRTGLAIDYPVETYLLRFKRRKRNR